MADETNTPAEEVVNQFRSLVQFHPLHGSPGFCVRLLPIGESEVELTMITIPAENRKQGIAESLLKHLLELAKKHGVSIELEASDNGLNPSDGGHKSAEWLPRWYRKLGFQETGEAGIYGPWMRFDPPIRARESEISRRADALLERLLA